MFKQLYLLLKSLKFNPLNRYPMGHFYSPIASKKELIEFETQIWEEGDQKQLAAIDLNSEMQLKLLKQFETYYNELPFKDKLTENRRYYLKNSSYSYTDGITLYSFLRHFKPKRVIEIGSGMSSVCLLDTKELFNLETELTFIEPFPRLLNKVLKENDRKNCRVINKKVQNVPIQTFQELGENDILFIDSSHVSKAGSDVNFEIFKILPALQSGVIIHFHDVFYPFEYPKKWILKGRNWTEDYLLRAFLSYNDHFEILFFSDYMHRHYKDAFVNMPLMYKNTGGNLWLRKK